MICFENLGGVFQGLAFAQARSCGGDINHVRAQSKRRQLEGSAGAGTWFDKKIYQRFPRSAGTFLISRVPTCLKASAVSRTRLISSADNSRSPSKSLRFQRVVIADVGEHRLPACSWRQPAANLDSRERRKWVQMRSASC